MSSQQWPDHPDPTGPPAGWPSSPPYQQSPYQQSPYQRSPYQQSPYQQSPPQGYGPAPTHQGPPHYQPTPPRDPRWSSTKMFFVVWSIVTGIGPIVGGLYGIVVAAVFSREVLENFGTLDEPSAAVGFGIVFGAIAGAMLGFFVGMSAGLAAAGVAAAMFRKQADSLIGLSAGGAALLVAALIAFSWTGATGPGDAAQAALFGLVPCLLVGLTGGVVALIAVRRAQEEDRRAGSR